MRSGDRGCRRIRPQGTAGHDPLSADGYAIACLAVDGLCESSQSPISGFAGKPVPVNGTRTAARSQTSRPETGPETGHPLPGRRFAKQIGREGGDGALGFWTALREVFATTREQRCWVHKAVNVLNAMPKSVQAKAKGHQHDIWQAETKAKANAAFDFLVEIYGLMYQTHRIRPV